MQDKIEETLSERRQTHGDFEQFAIVYCRLQQELHPLSMKDQGLYVAAQMIMNKLARIITGTPFFEDHWIDIQGYARLAQKHIRGEQNETK